MSDKHVESLREVRDHLSAAADHLDEQRPNSARRRVALARGIIERELDALAAANPTAETGAQGSDGQTDGSTGGPRSAEEWATRLFSPGRPR